jgi:sodium transport system permease protein
MRFPSVRNIGIVYRKEMLDLLRDKRTLFGMILLPLLIYPLLMVGLSQVLVQQLGRIEQQQFLVAVLGWRGLPELPDSLAGGEASWGVRRAERSEREALLRDLGEGRIHVVVDVPDGAAGRIGRGETIEVRALYNGADENSLAAWRRLQPVLDRLHRGLVERRLRALAVDTAVLEPMRVEAEDQATPSQRGAFHLGRLVCVMLVMMAATGAFYPAVDMASGEKERGTMQTLLVSPARRSEIVFGKYFAVFTVCLVTAVLNLASMGATFSSVFLPGELARTGALTFAPSAGSIAVMLLVLVPLAGFFCSVCLGLSAYAASYKEAMLFLSPFLFVAVLGAMAPVIPGLEPSLALQFVPVANGALVLYGVLQGVASPGTVFLNVAVNSVYALVALRWVVWIFEREDVLLRGAVEIDWRFWRRPAALRPGPSMAEGIACAMVMLALIVFIGGGMAGQPFLLLLLATQVGGFLLPLAAFLLAGGIDVRSALRLRFPGWTNLVVAALTAVAVLVLSEVLQEALTALYRRMGTDPAKAVEEAVRPFQSMLDLAHPATAAAAVFLFVVVAPFCEELAFRGFLLSAFRPVLGPGLAVAAAGILFGLLHLPPPRSYVLAGVGIMLGVMVVRSGSLWTGIVAHLVNNGLVVLVVLSGVGEGGRGAADAETVFEKILRGGVQEWAIVLLSLTVAGLGIWLLRPPPGTMEKGGEEPGART